MRFGLQCLLAAGVLVLAASSALAQNGNTTGINTVAAGAEAKQNAAILKEARELVKVKQAEHDELLSLRMSEYDKTPGMQSLIAAVDADSKNLNEVIIPAIKAKITEDVPDYPMRVAQRDEAKAKLEAVIAAKEKPAEVTYRTYEFHRMDDKIKAMESGYFDKNANYKAAVAKLKDDTAKLTAARAELSKQLEFDGDYKARVQALTAAKARLILTEQKAQAKGP